MTGTRDEDPWAHQLLSGAKKVIAPLRASDGKAAGENLVLAAALVLAAILAITGSKPQGESNDPRVVLLQGVLATLITLTAPEDQNQTMLLVRT